MYLTKIKELVSKSYEIVVKKPDKERTGNAYYQVVSSTPDINMIYMNSTEL